MRNNYCKHIIECNKKKNYEIINYSCRCVYSILSDGGFR